MPPPVPSANPNIPPVPPLPGTTATSDSLVPPPPVPTLGPGDMPIPTPPLPTDSPLIPSVGPPPAIDEPTEAPGSEGPLNPCRSEDDNIEARCYRESMATVKLDVSDTRLGSNEPPWSSKPARPVHVPRKPGGYDDGGVEMPVIESTASAKPLVYQYFSAWGVYLRDFSAAFIPCKHIDVSLFSFFQIDNTETCTVHSSDIGGDFQKGSSAQQIIAHDPINKPITYVKSANGSPYWETFFRSGNSVVFQELKRICPDTFKVAASIGGWTLSNNFT